MLVLLRNAAARHHDQNPGAEDSRVHDGRPSDR
jgi:hypothetical protein